MDQIINPDMDLDRLDILPILQNYLGLLHLSIWESSYVLFMLFERIESLKIQSKLNILLMWLDSCHLGILGFSVWN